MRSLIQYLGSLRLCQHYVSPCSNNVVADLPFHHDVSVLTTTILQGVPLSAGVEECDSGTYAVHEDACRRQLSGGG